MKILIKNGEVITVNAHNEVLPSADIAVEDGVIKHIGTVPKEFCADKIIEADNSIVMPGIVNTHTHSAMSLFRNYADDLPLEDWLQKKIWPAEAKLSADDVYWGTMLSIIEMIRCGTTTFLDMYFFMDQVAQAVEDTGMRAVLSRGLLSEGIRYDAEFSETLALFNEYHGKADGRMTVMLGPHAPYSCSEEYLKKVISLAKKLGIGIHIHLSESQYEFDLVKEKYGFTPVGYLNNLGMFDVPVSAAHCVFLTDDDIEILSKNNVNVLNNPASNLKLGNGFAPISELLKKGVNVSLGTDGVASNNSLNMFEEMKLAALINKGVRCDPTVVNAETTLRMATINGAKSLGLEQEIGSIEVGKKADIVLLKRTDAHFYPRYNTISGLVYSTQGNDVDTVMVDGKILMENKKLLFIDESRVIEEAEKKSRLLVQS